MPRSISSLLNLAQLDVKRQPAYQILVYDLRSTTDEIGDIVVGNVLQSLTGPLDITEYVTVTQIEEVAGDYIGNGIQASNISCTLVDPQGRFNPQTGDLGRWLRQGNGIRIIEGDARLDPSDWAITFTGEIVGQLGILRSRAVGEQGTSEVSFRAVDRVPRFLRYPSTSDSYGQGQSYLFIANDIAENDMQLDAAEIDFAGWGSQTTGHRVTQFVQEEPLVSIAKLMFIDGVMPYFDGEGKLTQTSGVITKSPTRIYEDRSQFISIERLAQEANNYNRICVLGLDANMTKVVQDEQGLLTIRVTTGYFTNDEEIEEYFSEDRTLLVEDVVFVVKRSVNGGLSLLGGGESLSEISAPGGAGAIGVKIDIETGYAPWLLVFLGVTYAALAAIPDEVAVVVTIPTGRVIQAIALAAMMIIMTKIGRGEYEVRGKPIEWVFKEIRGCRQVQGIQKRDRNQYDIENHLVQSQTDANDSAERVVRREQAKGNARIATMYPDLLLIPDDVFQFDDDDSRYMIDRITRVLSRDPETFLAIVDCFEVTPGVLP